MSRPTSFHERYAKHIESFKQVEVPEGYKHGRTPFRQWKITKRVVLWSRITRLGLSSRPDRVRADLAVVIDGAVTHLDLGGDYSSYEELEQAWYSTSGRAVIESAQRQGVVVEDIDPDKTPKLKLKRGAKKEQVGSWRKFTRAPVDPPKTKLHELGDAQRFYFDLCVTTKLAVRRGTWRGNAEISPRERAKVDEFFRVSPKLTWAADILRLRDWVHDLFPPKHPARTVVWLMLKDRRALYAETLETDAAYGSDGLPEPS